MDRLFFKGATGKLHKASHNIENSDNILDGGQDSLGAPITTSAPASTSPDDFPRPPTGGTVNWLFLPDEIVLSIFVYLCAKDLARCQRVCRYA